MGAVRRGIAGVFTGRGLVTGEGQVHINHNLSLDTSSLRAALSGESVNVHAKPLTAEALLTRALETITEASTAHWPERLRAVKPDLRRDVLRDFNESDAWMCKNIGVDQVLGAAAMAALWRRTFTAERDHRAGPGAKAQHRGQISRQLKAALQVIITDGND